MTSTPDFIPYEPPPPEGTAEEASRRLFDLLRTRRSVRTFSDRPVPRAVIENLIATAGTAPSGANKQPWRFVAVQDPAIKKEIRAAAEAEEREFYERRANEDWLRDLRAIGTDEHKPFLEVAPWLIVIFKMVRDDRAGALTEQVYYVNESVGIATGMLITAIHHAGLVTLTHTPSPMKFLARILNRPEHERPFLLLPVGYAAPRSVVPNLARKPLDEIMVVDR